MGRRPARGAVDKSARSRSVDLLAHPGSSLEEVQMTITTSVVLVDDATPTRTAVAGFLAGYCGATRRSYATDLGLRLTSRHTSPG